jgi:hypothetical protein
MAASCRNVSAKLSPYIAPSFDAKGCLRHGFSLVTNIPSLVNLGTYFHPRSGSCHTPSDLELTDTERDEARSQA